MVSLHVAESPPSRRRGGDAATLRAFSICSYYSHLEAADCPIWAALAVVVIVVGGGRGAVGNPDLTSAPTIALLPP